MSGSSDPRVFNTTRQPAASTSGSAIRKQRTEGGANGNQRTVPASRVSSFVGYEPPMSVPQNGDTGQRGFTGNRHVSFFSLPSGEEKDGSPARGTHPRAAIPAWPLRLQRETREGLSGAT